MDVSLFNYSPGRLLTKTILSGMISAMLKMKRKKNLFKNTVPILFLLVFLFISFNCCINTYAGEVPAADKSTSVANPWILASPSEWPFMFRPGTRGGNGRALFYMDYFVPVIGTDEALFFINPKVVWDNQRSNEQNIGCGLRNLFFEDRLILGGNFYFDTRETRYKNRFNQIGFGVEALSKWVDLRGNFYLSISNKKVAKNELTGYSFSSRSLLKHTSTSYEEPLTGIDYEGGVLVPYISNYVETKVYVGGYNYFPKSSKNINGVRGRIEIRPTPMITLEAEISGDNMSPIEGYVGGYVSLPFSIGDFLNGKNPFKGWKEIFAFGKGTRPVRERMTDMVVRDIDVVLQDSSATGTSKEHDLTYVDNSNAGAEDGSKDNPYNTVQEGVDNSIGDNWVYVQEGTSDYTENVILADGTTLWGSRYNGGFKGITSDSGPTINRNGSTVTMASNSTLMGFTVEGGTTDGVHAEDKTNFTIMENNITADNYGIQVRAAQNVTCSNITISGNTISNITGFGPVGLYVYNGAGTVSNLNIARNTITNGSGFGATGLQIYNDGGAMPDCNITGNTISNFVGAVSSGNGIYINNSASFIASDFVLRGNIVTNNSHYGFLLVEQPGPAVDSTFSLSWNTAANNTLNGVFVAGDPGAADRVDLGGGVTSSVGYNSFYDNGSGDVSNIDTGTIQAQYNWWGQAGGPSGGQTVGTVDTSNYLTSVPN